MAGKLTRLTHEIAIQVHLVAESCTICSSCSLWDTPSYYAVNNVSGLLTPSVLTKLDTLFYLWFHGNVGSCHHGVFSGWLRTGETASRYGWRLRMYRTGNRGEPTRSGHPQVCGLGEGLTTRSPGGGEAMKRCAGPLTSRVLVNTVMNLHIPWVVEWLLAPQEGLCSMELVGLMATQSSQCWKAIRTASYRVVTDTGNRTHAYRHTRVYPKVSGLSR